MRKFERCKKLERREKRRKKDLEEEEEKNLRVGEIKSVGSS